MKNFTIGLNVVLVIAVAILFYLHFSKSTTSNAEAGKAVAPGSFKIAYFEMDSVQNQFEYFKEVRNGLLAREQEAGRQLDQYKRNIAGKYQDLQSKAQTLSQAEIQSRQQELMDLDKEAKAKEQSLSQGLQDESFKKLQDVKKEIEEFLKQYNKDKGYSYILSNSSDLIYYKDTVYNITNDLVKGLNDLHKKKK
jgi:outer membrane protein